MLSSLTLRWQWSKVRRQADFIMRGFQFMRLAISLPAQLVSTIRAPFKGRNLKGKVCVITGGTSGIGLATAKELVKRGCDVVLLVRDKKKAAPVVEDIRSLNDLYLDPPAATVNAIECDLSSLLSVRMCVSEIKQLLNGRSLDFLACTAGVFCSAASSKGRVNTGQFDVHYSVNFLSSYALIGGLIDKLRTSHTKVVLLTSDLLVLENDVLPRSETIDLQGPQNPITAPLLSLWRSLRSYSSSKLASFALALELHRRFPELRVYSVHPGALNSHTYGTLPSSGVLSACWGLLKELLLVGDDRAAESILYCLTTDSADPGFYHNVFGKLPLNRFTVPPCLLSTVWRQNVWDESSRICELNEFHLPW